MYKTVGIQPSGGEAMPANLPPQYIELEKEYRAEKDPVLRLELLQRMLAEIPKHKGTDHLVGELKQKISRLKKQDKQKKSGAKRHDAPDHVPREGIAQYALVGPPNGGKSSLLAAMTNAIPEIAEFAFTTRKPLPGMTDYEGVQLQLIDLPPVCSQFCENWVTNVVRVADIALLVLSLGDDDILDSYEDTITRLEQGKIILNNDPPAMDQSVSIMDKRTILIANQMDQDGADDRLAIMREVMELRFPMVKVSAKTGENLDQLKKMMFSILGKIRVYTKTPSQEADLTDPVVLSYGATVADAAKVIHKDFAHSLQFAKIWGAHTFDGQRVKGDFEVHDGDVLEFHL
jgi:ribosome-interacting GTPase 1